MSPWYHAIPNGAVGACRTKSVKSVLGGRPFTWICMRSFTPTGLIVTWAVALGRQLAAPAETSMSNEILSDCAACAAASVGRQPRTNAVRVRNIATTLGEYGCMV